MAQRRIGVQQAADQHLLGLDRADPHQHGRQLAPDVERARFILEAAGDLGHDGVAEPGQRPAGRVAQLGATERIEQRRRRCLRGPGRARFRSPATPPRDPASAISAGSIGEKAGTSAMSRAASARSRAPSGPGERIIASMIRWAASRFWAGPGEARNAAMPARIEKSAKSPRRLDLGQRIDPALTRQIEQRLGADPEVGVVEQGNRIRPDLAVAGGGQQRQRPLPDVSLRVQQQRAKRRMPALGPLPFQQARARSGLPSGSVAAELVAQRVRGGALEHRRGGPLGVHAMAMDAVLDGADIGGAEPPGDGDPRRQSAPGSASRCRAASGRGPGSSGSRRSGCRRPPPRPRRRPASR